MRTVALVAVLALAAVALAGCSSEDPERYPDGVPSTSRSSTSRSGTGAQTGTGTGSSTGTGTGGPGGNGTGADPVANLTATPMNGTAPLNVTFTLSGSASGNLTWTFLFGDGNKTNGTELPATLVHRYSGGGNFTPTLTVSDGTREASANVTLRVDPGTVGFAPGLDPACQRPDAVGNDSGGWIDHRGGDSIWVYEESNDIPGLQLSMGASPIPGPIGGHTDPEGVAANCQNGDTLLF